MSYEDKVINAIDDGYKEHLDKIVKVERDLPDVPIPFWEYQDVRIKPHELKKLFLEYEVIEMLICILEQ
ncbi:hypothetical protein Metev_2341 (plasmid) [Methanohalobium evestigatum Z-7303]|uniref:Uncharacterized protein n=1 Tax=Methanohalobium evestigatum (strain ATCC BAA-1072 / DSM 3721 / NBRC 107634 / OCM 161 / Z-7303) TaxID=644295 RepID=D7EC31_METEZ|nr:hypothetical protein [Methanohalobium evestigatum]ADI75153.1 hypothetical protein Metev_2341 [Methanohalobium evestigatum Z-7303]